MLSYRHAFHAGNHADVLKHLVLLELLDYYGRKDKPWYYIDTHAGGGCYAFDSEQAGKTAEAADGIGRLWGREDLPPAVASYVEAVRQFNPQGRLLFYPGSPALAMTRARDGFCLSAGGGEHPREPAIAPVVAGKPGPIR